MKNARDSPLPIHDPRPLLPHLERRTDVRVDPEGPERVVEIEDEQFGQGAAVLEGLRGE